MLTSILFRLATTISLGLALNADLQNDVSNAIKSSNSKLLCSYFNDKVDLKILDQEEVYSRGQAELILKDFFIKNPIKSFTIVHNSAPRNGSQFAIGNLETINGKFRIYFLIKTVDDKSLVHQFRIEPENGE